MTLRQWLKERELPYEKVLAVHPGTDGFSRTKDNLMSVSATGSWPDADFRTAFVAGANAEKVKEYTEVPPHEYDKEALPLSEVEAMINPLVQEADFLVIWYANFSRKWLEHMMPDTFIGVPMLDLTPIAKAAEQKMELPVDHISVEDLSDRMQKATFSVKGGYKFDDVCARMMPGIDGDTPDAYLTGSTPKLERYVYMLYALWMTLLDK